jgi:signal transduction histidine kinase
LAEEAKAFDNHDLRLLQVLANQVAVAIDNARLFTTVQASEATMRDLSLRLLKVQEEERRRIAQALHDELGQLLTALKIDVDLARRKLPDSATSSLQRLDEASVLTDEVMTKIRALTIELRPPVLDDLGIVPTLRWYLERVAQRTNLQVQLEVPQMSTRLQPQIETAIYRTVQEGLTNVIRHAQATQVWVRLKYSADQLTVSIEDNGRGFDSRIWLEGEPAQQTLGLIGIKERAMLLGGRLSILSQPGQGTQIKLELPAHFLSKG